MHLQGWPGFPAGVGAPFWVRHPPWWGPWATAPAPSRLLLPPVLQCYCCSSACCCSSISTLDCSEGKISEETATSDNEVHLWHKMAEYKDMHSSSPERTLKLQVAAEQLLTGECWIPPKRDTPHPRAKEKPQQDGRRGKIEFRITPLPARDAQRAQTNLVRTRTQRPHGDWARTVFEYLLWRYKYMGRQWKEWETLLLGAPKSLKMVTAAMKLKDPCPLEGKLWPT